MKKYMGIFLCLCLAFLFAGNAMAQQWKVQKQKMEMIHQQIQQLRQQIKQETAKVEKMHDKLRDLQNQMRQTMASMMNGQDLELGSNMNLTTRPSAALSDYEN